MFSVLPSQPTCIYEYNDSNARISPQGKLKACATKRCIVTPNVSCHVTGFAAFQLIPFTSVSCERQMARSTMFSENVLTQFSKGKKSK